MDFITLGYVGLFLVSFLAATILPIGSEVVVGALLLKDYNFHLVIIIATIGNYLGATTTYYLGFSGRKILIDKYLKISDEKLEKAAKYFEKYGRYVLFFSWLPILGEAFTLYGGIIKYSFKKFTILVFSGKYVRYFLFGLIFII